MSSASIAELCSERDAIMAKIQGLSGALRGSVVERFTTCSRHGCACHRGKKHGPRYYLACTEGGRRVQRYIGAAELDKARQGVADYHELTRLLECLTQINLNMLRASDPG